MQTEFKEKRIKTPDGTTMVLFNGKLHSWDGPALIPQGNEKLAEYYINGIKMDHKQWKKALKGRDGLPWYKSGSAKARFQTTTKNKGYIMKQLTPEQAKKFIPCHEDGFTHLDPHYYTSTLGDDGWSTIEYYTNKPKREYAGVEGEQFVYVLSNKYMPGIVKIGFTTLNPYDRANILSKSTGVPDDFEMDFAYQCINGRKLEKAVHEKLKDSRIRKQREFFTVSLDTAIEVINLLGEQVR